MKIKLITDREIAKICDVPWFNKILDKITAPTNVIVNITLHKILRYVLVIPNKSTRQLVQ